MDKQELLNKKSELEKELGQVNKELWDYDVKQLAEQYKDKFNCEFLVLPLRTTKRRFTQ